MSDTKEFWDDDKVIDFVNWYVKLHDLDFRYTLENKTLIDTFKKKEKKDNMKYTYIILFKETKDDGIKWDFGEETPLISEIGKRVEAKPVDYDDILSCIEEDKNIWGEDTTRCCIPEKGGYFIGYKIVNIEEFEEHRDRNEDNYFWGSLEKIII